MKKTDIIKFLTAILASISLVLILVCAGVSAVGSGENIIFDFNTSASDWTAYENVTGARRKNISLEDETRSLLEVTSRWALPGDMRTVGAKLKEAKDLSGYRKIKYDIYVPLYEFDINAVYYTQLTLSTSTGDSMKYLELIRGGEWNTVEVNIGSWEGQGDIISMQISATIDTTLPKNGSYSFYIDDVRAEGVIDRELSERFLFDVYSVKNGTATLSADKKSVLMIPSESGEMSLEADIAVPELEHGANCLRIKLTNHTESDTMTLYYSTSDTQVSSEDKRIVIPIIPNSENRYYYANVGDISMLHSIKLAFDSDNGSMELLSISAVPSYEPESHTVCGAVNSCIINDDLASVSFFGQVDRDVALENRGGQIAVYSYNGDGLPRPDELLNTTPLATGMMTVRFELNWKLGSDNIEALYSRFIAVVLHEDGGYSLIAPPFYVDNPERLARVSYDFTPDLKGFESDDISLVGDTDAGVTMLTLYAYNVFASKSEGTQYIYNGEIYYLNGEYLDKLSAKIAALTDSGTQVLLRYAGWAKEYEESLAITYSEDDYVNIGKVANAGDGVDFLGALASYTAENWCRDGQVSGVVFGSTENFIAPEKSFRNSVKYTADCLRTVYMNLVSANSAAKVYISLNDLYTADPATNMSEIGLAEYLPALIAATGEYGQFPWDICIEKLPDDTVYGGAAYVEANNCDMIGDLLAANNAGEKHLIFCDSLYYDSKISYDEKLTAFVIGYYSALFDDRIDAYIARSGQNGGELSHAVRYIDTVKSYQLTNKVAEFLGVNDISELFDNWDKNKLLSRRIAEREADTRAPNGIRGRFPYYKFSGVASIGLLKSGYYAGALRIARDDGNMLSVQLDSYMYEDGTNAAWMGISHRFDCEEDFKLTPILALTLKLDEVQPALLETVPLKLVLFGKNERFESTAEIIPGEWTTVYVDISGFISAGETEGLQILVGDGKVKQAVMSVRSLEGLSREYNDESLESVVESARLKKSSPDTVTDYSKFMWVGGGVIVAVATVLAVALLSRRREDTDE